MERFAKLRKELWSCYVGVTCSLSGVTYVFFMAKLKSIGLW